MSKKILKRNLAVVSGASLALFGVTALPANAAYGPSDILITANAAVGGSNLSVFTTDELAITLAQSAIIPATALGTDITSIKVSSDDAPVLYFEFNDATDAANDGDTIKLTGVDADGDTVSINGGNAFAITADANTLDDGADGAAGDIDDSDDKYGAFVVDFDELGIVDLYIHTIDAAYLDNDVDFDVAVLENTPDVNDTDLAFTNDDLSNIVYSPHGDGSFALSIQAFLEVDGDVTTVDPSASAVKTMNFWDPADASAIVKVQRLSKDAGSYMLSDAETNVPVEVSFSRSVNLDQITLADWVFSLDSSTAGDDATDVTPTRRTMDGYDDQDDYGKLTATLAMGAGDQLDDGETISVTLKHEDADARTYRSPAATVVEAPDADGDDVELSLAPAATTEYDVDVDSDAATASTAAAAITYTATVVDAANDAVGANYPVMVIVDFVDAKVAATDTLTVSGLSGSLVEGARGVINGITNSDGEFTFTVTASNPAAGVDYTLDVFYVEDSGVDTAAASLGGDGNIAITYAAQAFGSVEADADVYNGTSITVDVSVADNFGEAYSTDDGDAIKVRIEATDTDDLELYANVIKGEATFTFTNFLAVSATDVLTITAFTGDNDDPTDLGSTSVTLYNSASIAGINIVDAALETEVVYADFVASGDEGYVAAADAVTLSGSVIDSVGQGVPGVPVTIAGAGLQFQDGNGDFTIGSVTVVADIAGAWSVDVWTHTADEVDVTVKSGSLTKAATVEGSVPDGNGDLSAANLKLSWNLPSVVVVDTTYAVTATLTDVWGNPIKNADLQFLGAAAALFNSSDEVVAKTTNSKGQATVYLRSLEGITGLAAVEVTVDAVNQDNGADEDVDDLTTSFTDNEDTSWNESLWSDTLSAEINFLKTAPAGTGAAKVNVGSFNGKLVVYAQGLDGAKISWKVGGKWGTAVASGNILNRFDRLTPRKGVTVSVDIYVNGVKTLTKSVVTR